MRKIVAIAMAAILSSAAQAATVDPAEYFAYGPMPLTNSTLFLSHAACADKGAIKGWKKALSSSGAEACWRDISNEKYGRNLEFCILWPADRKMTDVCGEVGLSHFAKTSSLPKSAF